MKITNIYASSYACQDSAAIYFTLEETNDLRPPFSHDADRIIYSLAFSRYLNKTQVFTYQKHDHLTKRMTHVIYVSKIARTIGRSLNLNEDLIEAAALGHDLGHTPFGHVGEKILNDLAQKYHLGSFNHNVHSVRLLKDIENYGQGLNISVQVLDAILCHNGEMALGKYEPVKKTPEQFLKEYEASYTDPAILAKMRPMTLEGCVVRISDLIAYLGRDIEDAVRLNLINYADIPKQIKKTLGTTNSQIISTIINDIITHSSNKPYIELSPEIFKAIVALKKFNYEHIYNLAYTKQEKKQMAADFSLLFKTLLKDLKGMNKRSAIVKYYEVMVPRYQNQPLERIVLDYIAGMTDDYFAKQVNKIRQKNHTRKEVEHDI